MIDKVFQWLYNKYIMRTHGKKQIDIREDNKVAVVDILLHKESTTQQMCSQLKLSHTALAKVMAELLEKQAVCITEGEKVQMGRPPKIYRINGDFAVACAASVNDKTIDIYYVDMRGFQINTVSCKNIFQSLEELLVFIQEKIVALKNHVRIEGKLCKYFYLGIPTGEFYGKTFAENRGAVENWFADALQEITTYVYSNIDCSLIAEMQYGILKGYDGNVFYVNLDDKTSASLLLNGKIYQGDSGMQGYDKQSYFDGLNATFGSIEAYQAYAEGRGEERLEKEIEAEIKRLADVVRFLDIREVVVSGKATMLGERFIRFISQYFPEGTNIRCSTMGKEVSSALSGAVWMATYNTLKTVILRNV